MIFKHLKKMPSVKVVHTWDDPLLAPEHRLWLDKRFGRNMIWFSRGGHLGNMYMKEVKEKIVEAAVK